MKFNTLTQDITKKYMMDEQEMTGKANTQISNTYNLSPEQVQLLQSGSQIPEDRLLMERQYEINKTSNMDDPFNVERYNNVNMPDAPIQYGGSMASEMLNDMEVPKSIRDRFWFIFHKDNTLTFLDEGRKQDKMLSFDIMKTDYLNSIPYYNYTFAKELEFGVLRNVFETKLDRALGLKGGNVKNERIMLQSQFSEQRNISEDGGSGMIREGFFKRLLGRR